MKNKVNFFITKMHIKDTILIYRSNNKIILELAHILLKVIFER